MCYLFKDSIARWIHFLVYICEKYTYAHTHIYILVKSDYFILIWFFNNLKVEIGYNKNNWKRNMNIKFVKIFI